MKNIDWKQFIENERKKYKMIGRVSCPVFHGENVHFNHHGFYHLIYKLGVPRVKTEVIKRFDLLSYVPKSLSVLKTVESEEKRVKNDSHAYFWTIKAVVNGKKIRIILRRLGDNGSLHFFSIMDE